MNNKPDKNTLISYLYGELSEEEKRRVDEWFAQHPEDNELLELQGAKKILSHLPDKAVIVPKIKFPSGASFWQHNAFRLPLGIAAGFIAMLFAAKLLGAEIEMNRDGFRLGFRQSTPPVQELIEPAVAKSEEETSRLKTQQPQLPPPLNVAQENFSKEDVRRLVSSLQAGQTKWLKAYLQNSETHQKRYWQSILADFAKYSALQQQNHSALEAKFDEMQTENKQFKNETQQILTGIISEMDGKPVAQNTSY